MIILDTNVISEIMRPNPAALVLDWLDAQPLSDLATTTINIAEIRYGLARLGFGRRRSDLERRFNSFLSRGLSDRVFDFDGPAADIYGDLVIARERTGRRLEGFDGLIAAIARSRALPIATRNLRDFDGCGLEVMSPWSASASGI
jgi:toxin FitB